MKKNTKLFALRHLGGLGLCVASLGVSAMDFSTAYQRARAQDPTLAQVQAKFEAAQEKLPQARAGWLPSVSLSANTTYNQESVDNRSKALQNDWRYNSHGYTLSLTQPLFRWQNQVGQAQAQSQVAQAELALAQARQELILRTAQAYLDVQQARENLAAAQAYEAGVARQLEVARQAFGLGTGIKTDVHDAETRWELAQAQLAAAQADLETKNRALEALVGQSVEAVLPFAPNVPLPLPAPAQVGPWVEAAQQNNLVLRQQRAAVAVATQEAERQRGGHYPTLDLVASHGSNSALSSGDRTNTDASRIGLQLTVPIYQGGTVRSKVTEAEAERRAAQFAEEAALRSATLLARQSFAGVMQGAVQVRAMRAAVVAAQSAMESNRHAFEAGVRLGLDVLNAHSQVLSARRDLSRAVNEAVLSHLRLKAAVGTLGDEDVAGLNALLQR